MLANRQILRETKPIFFNGAFSISDKLLTVNAVKCFRAQAKEQGWKAQSLRIDRPRGRHTSTLFKVPVTITENGASVQVEIKGGPGPGYLSGMQLVGMAQRVSNMQSTTPVLEVMDEYAHPDFDGVCSKCFAARRREVVIRLSSTLVLRWSYYVH